MSSWHTYPQIFNLGHRAVSELTWHPLLVEEKVDGSQFSFMVDMSAMGAFDNTLRVRSKNREMDPEAPESLFTEALETVKSLVPKLHMGWTYRAEYLKKPKHNTLAYSRVPKGHLIIFDINTGEEGYLSYEEKALEATRLGLECVPLLMFGRVGLEDFKELLQRESILGGQLIEGVVLKPQGYNLWGQDKKVLMGKHVSEAYKETHRQVWKVDKRGDVIQKLTDELRTPARWAKAVQAMRDAGGDVSEVRAIGQLIKEIQHDIAKEEKDYIKDKLWEIFGKGILKGAIRGFPEWFKKQLLEAQFEGDQDEQVSIPSN
jgi:hypothetical protein